MNSLAQIFSQIFSEESSPNNISSVISEFLQTQGINMNELWTPSVDVIETKKSIIVYVNIPGVNTDSINVDFFNNRVDIKGKRHRPFTTDNIIRKNEIIYGNFERKVILPISVTSRESVSINTENGVLIITIDKVREEHNRFSVRVGNSSGVQTSGNAYVTLLNDTVDIE